MHFSKIKYHAKPLRAVRSGTMITILLWSTLKVMISRQNPTNKEELVETTTQARYLVITPEELRLLVHLMPRRIEAVLKH